MVELDADLARDALPTAVDRRERLLGERLVARHPVHQQDGLLTWLSTA